MKKSVLKIFLFTFCLGIGSPAFAQEDKTVTAKLRKKYDNVSFYKDYYTVKLNERVGAADKQGNEIVAPKYDDIYAFQFEDYNYAEVKLNGKWGVVDKQGNEIVAPKYDEVKAYLFQYYNYTEVKLNEKWGIVDRQGNEIIPCEYTYILSRTKEIVILTKGGNVVAEYYPPTGAKWGMYNIVQKKWINCKYDYLADDLSEGLIAFNVGGNLSDVNTEKVSGGKWGYIDLNGEEVIPAQYETAGNFKDGAAMVSLNGQTTLIENPLAKGKANIGIKGGFTADVDINIPVSSIQNAETFAFLFANESYPNYSVPFAGNDGKIFKEYCTKTLGVPEQNIRFYENATIGNMTAAVNRVKEIADAYEGNAKFIIYYSGQGTTDESSKTPYLLPVDASLNNLAATGYSVSKLSAELSQIPSKSALLILDACFNGNDREGKTLASTRSVAIKAKQAQPGGNLIVFSAATGDETAYAHQEKNHGLFTYYILKKLQETKGEINYKALVDYVTSEVKKQSISKPRIQSPTLAVSTKLPNWQTLKVK
jgi:hypothetical protein